MSDFIKVELTEEQYDKISRIGITKLEVASIGCKMTIGGGSSDFEMTIMDKDRFNQSNSDGEALDMIDTTSKQVESLVKGDVVEWKNGDECQHKNGVIYTFIGKCDNPKEFNCILMDSSGNAVLSFVNELSKPESPEQKAERERDDRIHAMVDDFNEQDIDYNYRGQVAKVCAALYDAGYRKAAHLKEGE